MDIKVLKLIETMKTQHGMELISHQIPLKTTYTCNSKVISEKQDLLTFQNTPIMKIVQIAYLPVNFKIQMCTENLSKSNYSKTQENHPLEIYRA